MAGVPDSKLKRMRGWPAGIDNQSPESSLTTDEHGHLIALREAENVDLLGAKVRRRGGFTQVVSGSRVHSLWRAGMWPFALFVGDGVLRGFRAAGATFDIFAGMDPGRPLSYELAGERVFWTNGRQTGVVLADGTAAPWGCPNPAGQPVLTPVADAGGLDAGRYQVAITYVLASGEESGTGQAALVDVPDGGGITLAQIPQPVDAAVSLIRVYVSGANGTVLHHRQDLAVGATVAMIGAGRHGKPLDTQFMETMPAARCVQLHVGRLFTLTIDGTLRWSESLRYGLTRPTANRMRFNGDGQLLAAVGQGTQGAGLYVACGKRTYFMAGTPEQMSPVIAYPYGAVPGTVTRVPGSVFGLESADEVVYWMAANGVGVLGLPGGQVLPVRETQAAAPRATAGASLYRAQDGQHKIITALAGRGRPAAIAARDRMVVTIERHDQDA